MKHPVDTHVGNKIRAARWLKGLTQQQLADQINVKYQQVQKYENGQNRIAASKLFEIALALDVTIQSFFEGIE